ncbi:MAG TPA: hypothetical protein PK500_06675 [Candidatus Egerieousia sp.]|nr:hypothetical protein [Candidatus Egerieousia sp.]HPT06318.1 hypothetical protein [Candidatus Egerieousia sp.]
MKVQISHIVCFAVTIVMVLVVSHFATAASEAILIAEPDSLETTVGNKDGSIKMIEPPYSSVAEVITSSAAAGGDARVQRVQSSQFSSDMKGLLKTLAARDSRKSDNQEIISAQLQSLVLHNPINEYYIYTLKKVRV